jgi:hypothetical protein
MGNKNMVETPCYKLMVIPAVTLGQNKIPLEKRMPVMFKNESKPGKVNHSNFSQSSFKFF